MPNSLVWVIQYPDGDYQGWPRKTGARTYHPKVPEFSEARIYSSHTAAVKSIAHKGGEAKPAAVTLLEPATANWEPGLP